MSSLVRLVAPYGRKMFIRGAIRGINSFDQCEVNLGKALSTAIIGELTPEDAPAVAYDTSTNALIRRYRTGRGRR